MAQGHPHFFPWSPGVTVPTLSERASVLDNWRAGRKKSMQERRLKITEVGEGGQPR